MKLEIIDSITKINATNWNQLIADNNPLLSHTFLSALETEGCLGKQYGWLPVFFTLTLNNHLQAACPCYIKTNSYGEFVFDNAWADFYHKHQVNYFPKLVCSIPYTPTSSERILHNDSITLKEATAIFEEAIKTFCLNNQLSGAHILFNPLDESLQLEALNWGTRKSCQYHWHNQNYPSFDDFLATFTCKKRKNVKSERKSMVKQNLTLKQIYGNDLTTAELDKAFYYYQSTFDKKWGTATLTRSFFENIAQSLAQKMMVVFAYHNDNIVACSIFFISDTTLYGRYWGCDKYFDNLHFEACYYQGIEYCIKNNLSFFEPGAQGEHKIPRGFLPVTTYSSHWLQDEQFYKIIKAHVLNENPLMMEHCDKLKRMSPYKK
jgi:predicted N-acyltransferase